VRRRRRHFARRPLLCDCCCDFSVCARPRVYSRSNLNQARRTNRPGKKICKNNNAPDERIGYARKKQIENWNRADYRFRTVYSRTRPQAKAVKLRLIDWRRRRRRTGRLALYNCCVRREVPPRPATHSYRRRAARAFRAGSMRVVRCSRHVRNTIITRCAYIILRTIYTHDIIIII